MTATLTSARGTGILPKPPEDWKGILLEAELQADPLSGWKNAFKEWIDLNKDFRAFESSFFKNPEDRIAQRVHRGWACNLISIGEMLAVELIKLQNAEKAGSESEKQLGFLNTFLKNLQSTVATWHGFDRDEEANPLMKHFA